MRVHESKIYAGTMRDWWIYLPAQYQAEKSANLMVFQDGHDYVGQVERVHASALTLSVLMVKPA